MNLWDNVQVVAKAVGSGTSPTASFAQTPAAGSLLVAVVFGEQSSGGAPITMTSPGWISVDSNYSNNTELRTFYKIAGSAEPTTVTATAPQSTSYWAMALMEKCVPSGYTVTLGAHNIQANAAATSQTTPQVNGTTNAPALGVCAIGQRAANPTLSAEKINGVAATVEATAIQTSQSCALAVFDGPAASSVGTWQGQLTSSASAIGSGAIMVFTADEPPAAVAVATPSTVAVGSTVTLDGSGSTAVGGSPTYTWTPVSGPNATTGALSSTTAATVTYKAASAGVDVWKLTVTDSAGSSSTVQVTVIVVMSVVYEWTGAEIMPKPRRRLLPDGTVA